MPVMGLIDKRMNQAAAEAIGWQDGLGDVGAFDWTNLVDDWTKIAGDIVTYRSIQPGTTIRRNGETITMQNPGYPVLEGNLGLNTSANVLANVPGGMLTLGIGAVLLVLLLKK